VSDAVREAVELEETLAPILVPPGWMFGGASRFVNIYKPDVERMYMAAEIVPAHRVKIVSTTGDTLSFLDHRRAKGHIPGVRVRLRHWKEQVSGGKILDLGNKLIYDARWVYNGNLAHLLQHHTAILGYFKARLGIGAADCAVILERNTPLLARKVFDLLGYETIQTHRSVRAHMVSLQHDPDIPYHLLPFAALIQPPSVPLSTLRRAFIPRRGTRCLRNEREVAAVATAHGFTKVYLEDLSMADQFGLMRSVECLLAVHGAGLGHLCMRTATLGSKPVDLFEILSPGLVTDVFRKYVAALGGTWNGCRGDVNGHFMKAVEYGSNYKSATSDNFTLDTRALEACLKKHSFGMSTEPKA
jgi:hypothetical protein